MKIHELTETDSTMTVLPDGTKEWHNTQGQRHRLDGPARIDADGSQSWWQDGRLHRTDGPAMIYPNGTQKWWQDGKLHRTDGPANIGADGTQEWWQNGKRHRTDGPAEIIPYGPYGQQVWWQNGKRHRTDGPAEIYADGTQAWYINNVDVTENSLIKLAKAGDKETVMRQLLIRIKSNNSDNVGSYIDALQAAGIDWPELQTIQRSLRA